MVDAKKSGDSDGAGANRARSDPDAQQVDRARSELPYVTTSFESLMQRHEQSLYRTCRRLLGDHGDAEDAVQDTMIRVFHNLHRFEGRSSFKTWLFKIARNVCQTRLHKRAREKQSLLEYGRTVQAPADGDIEALDVDRLLNSASALEREILTLRFVSDLKIEEIAEVLALKPSAVKMRLYRAIERLKRATYLHER